MDNLLAIFDPFRFFRKSKKVQPHFSSLVEEPLPSRRDSRNQYGDRFEFDILNDIPVAICITDMSGKISYRNVVFHASIAIDETASHIFKAFPEAEAAEVSNHIYRAQTGVISGVLLTKQKTFLPKEECTSYSWTFACTSDKRKVIMTGKPLSPDPLGHLSSVECEDLSHQLLQGRYLQDMAIGSPASVAMGLLQDFAANVKQHTKLVLAQREREILIHSRQQTRELKCMFVRHIGHEIRSPLNAILNGLHMLSSDYAKSLSEDSMEILSDIEVACRSAVDIMDDLLIYEKLESDTLSLEYSHVDMIEITRELVEVLQYQAEYSKIALDLKVPLTFESIIVYADRDRITQALRNMIIDAIKFTPSNGRIVLELMVNEMKTW